MSKAIRHDWTLLELQELYQLSILELISRANTIHSTFHTPGTLQLSHLISIKTGGCTEDCKYCPQSARYKTHVNPTALMSYDEVMKRAKEGIAQGATRICMGAAWREARDDHQFERILQLIRGVASLGVEVCVTLGMLTPHLAARLKTAGLYAYNHNLDTSENFYPSIISTRTYADRLNTLDVAEAAGLSVCCGGIIGMGESIDDRLQLIQTLSSRNPHPESVPINRLLPVPGTPMENQPEVPVWDMVRIIAIARITMPQSMVRYSCGRLGISEEGQALAFLAGANSIHVGDKLLTCSNFSKSNDATMQKTLGIKVLPAYTKSKPLCN